MPSKATAYRKDLPTHNGRNKSHNPLSVDALKHCRWVGAIDELTDILYFFYSVGEVFIIDDSTEFKGIFHVTTFFVTTFFVMMQSYILFLIKARIVEINIIKNNFILNDFSDIL